MGTATTTSTSTTTTTGMVGMGMGEVWRLRLLQLSSPALPIGAYAYSHGLEQAVTAGQVHDEDSARTWILGVAEHCIAPLLVPLLSRLMRAHRDGDADAVERWEAFACAARESEEFAVEDRQMGKSLARLLSSLGVERASTYAQRDDASHASLFALACVEWGVPLVEAQHAALYAFCENQAVAAMKIVPLGQTAGQRILSDAILRIPDWIQSASELSDDELGPTGPGLAIASARHEQQYSRLFRS